MNQLRMVNLSSSHSRKALFFTVIVAAALLLLMWLMKWEIPSFERPSPLSGVEVEVNWPPDPPEASEEGGGGGGNPVEAAGPVGVATASPISPGENVEARFLETDPHHESPPIAKALNTKSKAKAITVNSSHKKLIKKVETPAPPKPRALMGKSLGAAGNGGGSFSKVDQAGGQGSGWGVGQGIGNGGGTGTGIGGGAGSGTGSGIGPRVTKGDRIIVRTYAFEGDLDKATVYATIKVSPEGTGQLIGIAKGSSHTGSAYRTAITHYLDKMRFDASDHVSIVTVQFNFRVQ